ncbi:hypothetical protein RP20_CCG023500 [Aedes albopictus]|nr:hypothetical protein RP20_CCG023500 [Aedes albopictus]
MTSRVKVVGALLPRPAAVPAVRQDDVEGEGCGSTTATAGSSTSSNEGVIGAVRQSGSQRRKSRITYDREQGVRYYRGTATTDSNDCDCEDI